MLTNKKIYAIQDVLTINNALIERLPQALEQGGVSIDDIKDLCHTAARFNLSEKEQKRCDKFIKKHKHKKWNLTAIGGRFTYLFTPTSVGTGISIKCTCGKKKDITDYSDW